MELRGVVAALVADDGEEHVVAPVLERVLELRVRVAAAGDPATACSAHERARIRARAALAAVPEAMLGLACVQDRGARFSHELIAVAHRSQPFDLVVQVRAAPSPPGELVHSLVAAEDAAERMGFPARAVSVGLEGEPREVVTTGTALRAAVALRLADDRAVWMELDRRAPEDPERRWALARAASELAARLLAVSRAGLPDSSHRADRARA